MSTIDIHTHAFPDKLAPRAIESLEAQAPWQAAGDGTVAGLVKSMDAADIDISVVCMIATKPEQVSRIFKWCKRCKKVWSDRIDPFPSVHPDVRKPGKWVSKIAKAGFVGIKLHPMYQNFLADDAKMDDIYAAASDNNLVVTLHCGRDIAFDDDDDRAAPGRIAEVAGRFEHLKLLCTHMGGWNAWDDVEKYLLGSNVYMETSFAIQFLGNERTAEFIKRHGPEKVMFGTDWPWQNQADAIKQINALPLTKQEKRGILLKNAASLLGLYG